MFEYHGYEFTKLGYVAGGKIQYQIKGPGIDEIRETPLAWNLFRGLAEEIAAELAGVETANLNFSTKQKRPLRKVTAENDSSDVRGWFVEKW